MKLLFQRIELEIKWEALPDIFNKNYGASVIYVSLKLLFNRMVFHIFAFDISFSKKNLKFNQFNDRLPQTSFETLV